MTKKKKEMVVYSTKCACCDGIFMALYPFVLREVVSGVDAVDLSGEHWDHPWVDAYGCTANGDLCNSSAEAEMWLIHGETPRRRCGLFTERRRE